MVPLIAAAGAGAEMRRTLGTAVFSGMVGVTLFGIFLTPVFFYVIEGIAESPVFSSARAQQIGKFLRYFIGMMSLGLIWLVPYLLGELLRRKSKPEIRIPKSETQTEIRNPKLETRNNVEIQNPKSMQIRG